LIVLGGLPGSGKSTVARALAARVHGALLRIDEVEAAMWRSGVHRGQPTGLAAYVVAESIAEGCLRAGTPVVVDAVNPVEEARRAWRELARRTNALLHVVEVVCSDPAEHRRRVEERRPDIDGHEIPTWQQVLDREYEPWSEERLVLDTARPNRDWEAAIDAYLTRGRTD
jgi:predicted kinase